MIAASNVQADPTYRYWNHTAIECDNSHQDCANCTIWINYERHKNGLGFNKCNMPESIQKLRETNVIKPDLEKQTKHDLKSPYRKNMKKFGREILV